MLFHKSVQFLTLTSDKTAGITENFTEFFTEFFFVRNIFSAVKRWKARVFKTELAQIQETLS